jgi:Raf kinase inhibitor-like YbhB/YbcL family protein
MDRDRARRAPNRLAALAQAARAARAALPAAVLAAGAFLAVLHAAPAATASAAATTAPAAAAAPSAAGDRAQSLSLTSGAFANQGEIPAAYSCEVHGGREVSPPLSWSGVPPAAKSLALIADDPDAPDPAAPRTTWVHWVLYDLPPAATGLPAGVAPGQLPPGSRQGVNDWGRTGYGAPCPPVGRHRYFFKLYALDVVLPDLGVPNKARLEERLHGHVLAQAELIGTYRESGR